MVVYDPFIGTGTTAIACKELNMDCYGSELSAAQINFARERIKQMDAQPSLNLK
jgi:DNA modification methylase